MSNIQIDTNIHMGCRTNEGNYVYNWYMVDMNSFKASHNKTIFMLGGNTTNCEEAANGNAKVVDRLISDKNRDRTTIYSMVYDDEPISSESGILTEKYREEAHDIFPKLIKPMLFDSVGNIKEKQGVERALGNIVLVAHCGGSEFVNIIIDDIYDCIAEHYHESIAKQLIGKIKYFAYAPCHLPNKPVTSFIITPFLDNNCSWTKVFDEVADKKVYADYPRGAVKSLLKARERGELYEAFKKIYRSERMIALRSEQSTYIIPNRLNANLSVGDHSIDCLVKRSVIDADADCAKTARVMNTISQLILNQFVSSRTIDQRDLFDEMTSIMKKNKPYTINSSDEPTSSVNET